MQGTSTKVRIQDYTDKYALDAFQLCQRWVQHTHRADVVGMFRGLNELREYSKIVLGSNNQVLGIFYPDIDTFNINDFIQIHCIVSDSGCKYGKIQSEILKSIIDEYFDKGFYKIAISFPSVCRLAKKVVEDAGLYLEGIHRKEWKLNKGKCDILYFGILKDEWRMRNGKTT